MKTSLPFRPILMVFHPFVFIFGISQNVQILILPLLWSIPPIHLVHVTAHTQTHTYRYSNVWICVWNVSSGDSRFYATIARRNHNPKTISCMQQQKGIDPKISRAILGKWKCSEKMVSEWRKWDRNREQREMRLEIRLR